MSEPLYFITGNANKFREVAAIIPNIQQLKLDLDEIQSLDSQVVMAHKLAQAAAQHSGRFIVDDVSLQLACLDGFPGPLVKWFLKSLGVQGIADLVHRYDDHHVTGITTLGYRDETGSTRYFNAQYHGTVVYPRGTSGFGFDPIFMVDGQTKTNAELSLDEKNALSARGQAARALAKFLTSQATAN